MKKLIPSKNWYVIINLYSIQYYVELFLFVFQIKTLTNQVEMTNTVVRKLEEKERILQNSLATVEKECSIRQQAMEMHKRKAIESTQSAADLKLHLGNYFIHSNK